jgi:hypothetical protein
MLELALLPIPLNVSERNPLLLEGALNRHEVLHGVDTSYATARNSLRAVSWLQYVALFSERDEVATARKSRDGAEES